MEETGEKTQGPAWELPCGQIWDLVNIAMNSERSESQPTEEKRILRSVLILRKEPSRTWSCVCNSVSLSPKCLLREELSLSLILLIFQVEKLKARTM